MPQIFAELKKELSFMRVIANLVITGATAAVIRLVAWLVQVDFVNETAYWSLVPALLFIFLLGARVVLGPYFRPHFSISVEWLAFATNKEGQTLGYIVALARNTGMASTLDSWKISTFPVGGSEIVGQRVALTSTSEITIGRGRQTFVQTFVPEDWLMNQGTDSPVPRGGRIVGVLIALFDGVSEDDLARPGTRTRITGSDCFGVDHGGEHVWSKRQAGPLPVLSGLKSPPPKKHGD